VAAVLFQHCGAVLPLARREGRFSLSPMTLRQFYDWQTAGGGGDVSQLVATLERAEIAW